MDFGISTRCFGTAALTVDLLERLRVLWELGTETNFAMQVASRGRLRKSKLLSVPNSRFGTRWT